MRSAIAGLVLVATVFMQTPAAEARTAGSEAGLAVSAAFLNLIYVPTKMVVAIGGALLGGFVGWATGGDTRAAYGVWVPAASGTYVLTPDTLDGTKPLQFFGTDYADVQTSVLESYGTKPIN